jgi:hypothetical protein
MAESDYVEPLTGEEIIIDLCSQIAEKLRRDCNLRGTDSYAGGYSAKVTVHVEAYGIDTVTVEAKVNTGQQQDNPDELIDATFDVPVEGALNEVRERSDQPVPSFTHLEGGEAIVRPRRYVRRERVAE